jgi:hypothetical protein
MLASQPTPCCRPYVSETVRSTRCITLLLVLPYNMRLTITSTVGHMQCAHTSSCDQVLTVPQQRHTALTVVRVSNEGVAMYSYLLYTVLLLCQLLCQHCYFSIHVQCVAVYTHVHAVLAAALVMYTARADGGTDDSKRYHMLGADVVWTALNESV